MSFPSGNLLREFKGDLRAPLPLHPFEKALTVVAALNVCSLPWMLGGMRPWAQFISLGISLVAFILALVPRNYDGDLVRGDPYRIQPAKKLLHWPLFWIGLVFFGYVLIQAFNPAWEFVQMEKSWGMRQIAHIEWLPTGMRTPFEMMNPWRQMMIWGAPFILVSALWAGFTRRKSVINLLTAIVANATILAIVGIVARATANGSILWLIESRKDYAYASFIYKNHAGSFFALALGIAIALAVYYHRQAIRKHRRSSPAVLFILAAMIAAVAVLQSYSRAAIIITGAFLVVVSLIGLVRLIRKSNAKSMLLVISLFAVYLTGFTALGSKLVNSTLTLNRFEVLSESSSVWRRQTAWDAGLEMANDKPAYGWGSGGFRFLFPKYQYPRPELLRPEWNKNLFYFWEFIHNDYLQLLIETGRVGSVWITLGFMFYAFLYLRRGGLHDLTSLTLLGASGITFAHAAVDFPMQNPAILTTFAVSLALALSLVTLERRASNAPLRSRSLETN
ncbi:MAG: O-antigen ligase [Synoicihabitans sp.]